MSKDLSILLNYRRLKEIKRCNNFSVLHNEDDAQHSFYVTLYSVYFADEFNRNVAKNNAKFHHYDGENTIEVFDLGVVMKKAFFHDIEEAFTSDISHNVKHHSSESRDFIKEVVSDKLESILSGCNKTNIKFHYWNKNDKSGKEGDLISIVDLLELALYSAEEVSQGNHSMMKMVKKCIVLIEKNSIFTKLYEYSPTFKELFDCLKTDNIEEISNMFYEALNID